MIICGQLKIQRFCFINSFVYGKVYKNILLKTILWSAFVIFGFQLLEAEDIQVIAVGTFRPFYEEDKNGEVIGMTADIVRATLSLADIHADIHLYPSPRALSVAKENENVLIFTIFRTPEREDHFKWVAPITPPIKSAIFKLSSHSDIKLERLEDAKKYTIGVVRGNNLHSMFLREGFEDDCQLEPVTNNDQNIQKLFTGRIDLCLGRDLPFATEVKQLGFDWNQVTTELVLDEDVAWMTFSASTSDKLVERVRKAFEQIQADGTVDAIIHKTLNRVLE
ncbi:MAG: transporter substrate-binding domain-containing protein [Candidatus Cloacimonetes bacterium]|nr:transporter substrate-binding domain-containing protein [Candidatus Cloacimonadota bacterium]